MRILNIVASPRGDQSASIAIVDSFLLEYEKRTKDLWSTHRTFGLNRFPNLARKR